MTWTQTFIGAKIDYLNPDPKQIKITDIAWALAHNNRFTGHTSVPYTVAHHSIAASTLVPSGFELQALLHDATEAYLSDLATPIKNLLPEYRVLEQRLAKAIGDAVGLELVHLAPCVKHVDMLLLITEREYLQPNHTKDWPGVDELGIEPLHYDSLYTQFTKDTRMQYSDRFDPGWTFITFMDRYYELVK